MSCLLVAFQTTRAKGADKLIPEFMAPSNYKDSAKISAYIKQKEADYLERAADQPYTGYLSAIRIFDSESRSVGTWTANPSQPSVAVSARTWLLKHYPAAWSNSLVGARASDVIFVGFNIRQFLKMLGIECSLPLNQPEDQDKVHTLPLDAWYDSKSCDLEAAVMPSGFDLSWGIVLAARGLAKQYRNWPGPGSDLEEDFLLTVELATQLGILARDVSVPAPEETEVAVA
jgi:hypothetical protein